MTSDMVRGGRGLSPQRPVELAGKNSGAERGAASAGGLSVRIADHELSPIQPFAIIDFRAAQILEAHRIDQELDALILDAGIPILQHFVKLESVLQPRAAAPWTNTRSMSFGLPSPAMSSPTLCAAASVKINSAGSLCAA